MKVGIVGLGYVGLPLAVAFAEAGSDVVGLDASSARVDQLAAGSSPVEDIPDERLGAVSSKIAYTTDFEDLKSCDAISICVPTPLANHREPDLSHLLDVARRLGETLVAGQLVVLESTTYPGTTRDELGPLLSEGSGLTPGEDFHLAFSPERIDPGRTDYTVETTPKVVGGITPTCCAKAEALYSVIAEQVVVVSSPEVAELTKLLENIFRSVNIALVNELAQLCDRMQIDVWEVIDAASTKPFGFMRFEPGPGMGGHCLPVDPFYLAFKAREHNFYTEFIELAGKTNQAQPIWCVNKVQDALNKVRKPLNGSKVAVLGVAYKGGVSDIRESPALTIIELLQAEGAEVSYHDPHVPELPQYGLSSADLATALPEADAVCIVTAHPEVDHEQVVEQAQLVVDFRGVTRGFEADNVALLGTGNVPRIQIRT